MNRKWESLVLENLPLVRYVLRALVTHLPPSVDHEDLVEAGFIGLIDAARKFDPLRGVKFRTYAVTRVRGSMLDELRAQDWLPRTTRNELSRLSRTEHELHQKLCRVPTVTDLCKALKCSPDYVRKLRAVALSDVQISLHSYSDSGEETETRMQHAGREIDPRDRVEFDEQKRIMAVAVEDLPPNERAVIQLYYFDKRLLREIGEKLKLSDSRICQIHRSALERLRYAMKRQELPTPV
jgi:RNA polymerase sigma factor for flagellar operon FliA